MKISVFSFYALFLLSCSGKKAQMNNTANAATAPLLYQVFDKNGNDLFNAQVNGKDSVLLSGNNGLFYDQLEQSANAQGNTQTNPVNGVIVSDTRIARYNNPGGMGANQLNTFNISYHGASIGIVTFKLKQQHPLWVEAAVFTLNSVPAKLDSSTGVHIYKLQLQ